MLGLGGVAGHYADGQDDAPVLNNHHDQGVEVTACHLRRAPRSVRRLRCPLVGSEKRCRWSTKIPICACGSREDGRVDSLRPDVPPQPRRFPGLPRASSQSGADLRRLPVPAPMGGRAEPRGNRSSTALDLSRTDSNFSLRAHSRRSRQAPSLPALRPGRVRRRTDESEGSLALRKRTTNEGTR